MKHLLLSAAPLAVLLALPASAASVCPTIGTFTTCTGSNLGEVKFGKTVGGQTVIISPGATLTNTADDAVRMRGDGNTVINNGTINGAYDLADGGSDGIDAGADLTVYNNGTITATNKAIDAEQLNGLTVYNTGTITAYDKAIRNQNGKDALLVNAAGALIESQSDEGFESGDDAEVLNSGIIRAGDDAVQVGKNASIYNAGTLQNVYVGTGPIEAADPDTLQDALDIDSGTVVNTGTILAEGSAGIDFDANVDNDIDPELTPNATSYVVNSGLIQGREAAIESDARAMGAQVIHNSGSLVGTQGTALMLFGGDDSLVMQAGGTITGASLFGEGADSLVFESSFAAETFDLFDGGLDTDTDTVSFLSYAFGDLSALIFGNDIFTLTFSDAFTLALGNWDVFSFSDATYTAAEMADLATPAPVPVPAAGLMLLGGLGGLAALRRRRRAA